MPRQVKAGPSFFNEAPLVLAKSIVLTAVPRDEVDQHFKPIQIRPPLKVSWSNLYYRRLAQGAQKKTIPKAYRKLSKKTFEGDTLRLTFPPKLGPVEYIGAVTVTDRWGNSATSSFSNRTGRLKHTGKALAGKIRAMKRQISKSFRAGKRGKANTRARVGISASALADQFKALDQRALGMHPSDRKGRLVLLQDLEDMGRLINRLEGRNQPKVPKRLTIKIKKTPKTPPA